MGSPKIDRIYGVDFSGDQNAGNKIWLASGSIETDELFIESCFPARNLPNSARDRDSSLSALRQFIENKENAAFGLDFPFGLPKEMISDHSNWEDFVTSFSTLFDGPVDLHEKCKEKGKEILDEGVEIRRETDDAANAPFCPYNWRMKSQVYYGIGHLLGPLVERGIASILPMQNTREKSPWVIEVCPSSTLKERGLAHIGYKDSGEVYARTRQKILTGLQEEGLVLTPGIDEKVVEDTEGDALDSLVAAFATYRAIQNEPVRDSPGIEGHIYI